MTKQDFLDLFAKEATVTLKAALYRKLALKHHPDMGGDLEAMKMLNLAFEDVRKGLDREEDKDTLASIIRSATDLLNKLGLDYEITGAWVWVESSEATKAVKADLMAAGFRWGSKKKRWYYAGVPANGRGASMDYIRQKYGSRKVTNDRDEKERISA